MEEALRRKLLADADGMGDDRRLVNLSKMVLKYFQENDDVANNGTANNCDSISNSLRKMQNVIQQSEIAMRKTTLANRVAEDESANYAKLSEKIVADIEAAHQRIAECKKELQDAKQIRKQKQEYDSLAALIKKHRARTETYARLEELKQQMKTSAEKRDQCVQMMEDRKKQFHVLMISLQELSALVKSDVSS